MQSGAPALYWALAKAGVRYVKLRPNKILAFRKARGLRAKTDRIDAALIAQYLAEAKARADRRPPFAPTSACGRSPPDPGSWSRLARPNDAAPIWRAMRSFARAWLSSSTCSRKALRPLNRRSSVTSPAMVSSIASPRLCAPCAAWVRWSPRRSSPTCPSSPSERQANRHSRRLCPADKRKWQKKPASQNRPRKTARAQRPVQRRPGRHSSSFVTARLLRSSYRSQPPPRQSRPRGGHAKNPRHRPRRRSRSLASPRPASNRLTSSTADGRVNPRILSPGAGRFTAVASLSLYATNS
jgi:hypothetical protein